MTAHRAGPGDVERIAPLFAEYRRFYGRPYDEAAGRGFLARRTRAAESVLLYAVRDGAVVGFAQLYPTFSSVALGPVWTLNDLYVASPARRGGVAGALLAKAAELAGAAGARSLTLRTAWDNEPARRLYERHGFTLDHDFATYALPLTG